jgi:hypothetical protein
MDHFFSILNTVVEKLGCVELVGFLRRLVIAG